MEGIEGQSEQIDNSNEIKLLFESDQKDRQGFSKDPTKGLEIRQRDEQRLKKAWEIAAQEKVSSPHDLNMLAFIFQHGDTAEDYQKALDLTTKAVESGLPPQDSLIPQATDRLMVQEQLDRGVPLDELKQKYGTQIRFDECGNQFKPSLDGTITNEDLEKFGIKQ